MIAIILINYYMPIVTYIYIYIIIMIAIIKIVTYQLLYKL